jgi:hypothetical protein
MSLLKKIPGQPEAETAPEVKKKRPANPELSAMRRIDEILAELSVEEKKRVLNWVVEKHLPPPQMKTFRLDDLFPLGGGYRTLGQDRMMANGPAMVNGSTTEVAK